MIVINNLTRFYGDLKAVDNVSFTVQQGEIIGLLGHNGAGKTSIMKMITGFLEHTEGTIKVDNLTIGPDTHEIQKLIGYLPENCPVWPEMTVIDYLNYQASLHSVPETEQISCVAKAIARTGLKEKATSSIQTLSRGYRQRVGVAQAILHNPKIIILDEPTNGLDPTQIHQMRGLIKELAKTATVILSTHILQEVQAVCERVLIMRAGKLVVDSRIDELQSAHKLRLIINNKDAATYLSKVEGVIEVKSTGPVDDQTSYSISADNNIAPAIAESVMKAGDKLYQLTPEIRNLETLFAEVNEIKERN